MGYSMDMPFDGDQQFDIEFGFDAVYTGSYEIDPTVDGYTLETANKRMIKDLTVKQIALSSVRNASGGNTITIAGNS